jgi:hypothetical protein
LNPGEPNTPSRNDQNNRNGKKSANVTDGNPVKKSGVHFGDTTTKKHDGKKPKLQASDIPARLPWNKSTPKTAADFIKLLLFVCIHTGDPRYKYDAPVDNVQKDEHQRIMTGRPYRRRHPLKKIDTAEKKGVTTYGNCGQCYPDVPPHSTDNCKYGPAARASRRVSSAVDTSTQIAPPDREPQTPPKGISTGPVTAVGFASINVEIRT